MFSYEDFTRGMAVMFQGYQSPRQLATLNYIRASLERDGAPVWLVSAVMVRVIQDMALHPHDWPLVEEDHTP